MSIFYNYIYDINLLIIVGLGLLLCAYKPSKLKTFIFLTATGMFMLFIFAFRYGIGFDYFNYFRLLNECKQLSFIDILTFKGPVEPGFNLLLKLISLITNDIVVMYLLLGFIILFVLMVYIYKNSAEPWISVYLFVTFGFFFGTMNLVRQYFSAIVFLYGIKYIQKRRFLPFLLILLLAMSIHKSAIIMLPVYFIAKLNVNWKTLSFYSSLTLLAYIFCDYIINFATKYIYQAYDLKSGELKSFMSPMSWIFVFVPFIYCLTAILMKNKLLERNPDNIVLINFSIYTLPFWILLTKHLLIERPSNCLYISSIILGSEIVACLTPSQDIKQKICDIKQSISDMEQKNIVGKPLELKSYELKKAQEKYNEAKSYYITAIVTILFLGFCNQVFAISHKNHNVSPYKSIFNQPRNVEHENIIKQIGSSNND